MPIPLLRLEQLQAMLEVISNLIPEQCSIEIMSVAAQPAATLSYPTEASLTCPAAPSH